MDIDNLPAGLPSDFLDEKCPKIKVCPDCEGQSALFDMHCHTCSDEGFIAMTPEELRDEIEERNEPKDL